MFLPSGDPAMAEEFVSPDIVVHFSGQELRGRETYLDMLSILRQMGAVPGA